MTTTRPLPVPDETSAPYWAAAARHELAVARCGQCATLTMPPQPVCLSCGTTEPDFDYVVTSGRGVIRSWTVVRTSFLPGFEVPFVLVDVELDDQDDLRLIGRLLGSANADELHLGAAVRAAFEDLADGVSVPAFELRP